MAGEAVNIENLVGGIEADSLRYVHESFQMRHQSVRDGDHEFSMGLFGLSPDSDQALSQIDIGIPQADQGIEPDARVVEHFKYCEPEPGGGDLCSVPGCTLLLDQNV
ncbi:hypothetical protein ALP29_201159 [Pseudomonas syringae pv. avii]|uniref:Uncharacterized protein n=1 Tax=Pseudomonas syringae pv. avii TaxID=663959 RepID=A0A3M5UGV2_PSESX|nr:hypothetical protein ALP29_201159 [Pseudomonas syringae pv. avii]